MGCVSSSIVLVFTLGLRCDRVWTGGWTHEDSHPLAEHWKWYYTDDLAGPSASMTFSDDNTPWTSARMDENALKTALVLLTAANYDFADFWPDPGYQYSCYLCECSNY